ncbi:MAG: hypothetical protein ABJ205_06740 [Erythrobacter sp.]|uniref:DUF6984 family protein n=1 Tax=Erythrobacter sp. TaxID=1042 RepID=UPI003267F12B
MSEESSYLDNKRKALVEFLSGTSVSIDVNFQPANDGGMGGFSLVSPSIEKSSPTPESEAKYVDTDGIEVLISLFCDRNGNPASVDFWKHDFSSLVEFPTSNQVERIF